MLDVTKRYLDSRTRREVMIIDIINEKLVRVKRIKDKVVYIMPIEDLEAI